MLATVGELGVMFRAGPADSPVGFFNFDIDVTSFSPSSPTVANSDAFILSKNQQLFSSQLAAELS